MDINYIKYTPVITSTKFNSPRNFSFYLPGIIAEFPKSSTIETPEIPEEAPIQSPILKFRDNPFRVPTNLNLQDWDLNKTLQHLRKHANDKSTHYCARAVREALEAGGLTGFRVPNAKDEEKLHTLESIGFVKIADATDNKVSPGYTPQAGDIAISYENGNHASMYDGTRWISDFKQNDLDVYKLINTKSSIYRRIQPETLIASRQSGGIFQKVRELAKQHRKN